VNAWWLADAAWVSYLHLESDIRKAYEANTDLHADLISVDDTDCTLAHNDRFAIVAFRGTQPDRLKDIFADAEWFPRAWDIGHVHRGFARALNAVWPMLEPRLDALHAGRPVWFTGHSLGAALATLAAYRVALEKPEIVVAGAYTFGSPLVGNQVFAAHFNAVFVDRSCRYVNHSDIVTRVPPETCAFPFGRYTHVDALRWIDRDGHIRHSAPTPPGFFSDAIGDAKMMVRAFEHMEGLPALPDALRDHTPVHYAIRVWNDFAAHRLADAAGV
jgi:triacylglycerol lipase